MNRGTAEKKSGPLQCAALAEELAGLFERLIESQVSLRTVLHVKLEAMRRVDAKGMLAAAGKEGEIVSEVTLLDQRRRQIVDALAAARGPGNPADGNGMTLQTLFARLPRDVRQRLAPLSRRLREEMLRVAEANRVVELVCREMAAHFKALFAALVNDGETAATYQADGGVGPAAGPRVLDAMG